MTDYVKLTAYFDERLRHGDRFISDALLDLYGENASPPASCCGASRALAHTTCCAPISR